MRVEKHQNEHAEDNEKLQSKEFLSLPSISSSPPLPPPAPKSPFLCTLRCESWISAGFRRFDWSRCASPLSVEIMFLTSSAVSRLGLRWNQSNIKKHDDDDDDAIFIHFLDLFFGLSSFALSVGDGVETLQTGMLMHAHDSISFLSSYTVTNTEVTPGIYCFQFVADVVPIFTLKSCFSRRQTMLQSVWKDSDEEWKWSIHC